MTHLMYTTNIENIFIYIKTMQLKENKEQSTKKKRKEKMQKDKERDYGLETMPAKD